MLIPPESLEPETLRRVVEEAVTRDGTELTDVDTKVDQALRQLRAGRLDLHYDEQTQTTSLVPRPG